MPTSEVKRYVAYCDGPREHELVVITNGARAYIYGGHTDAGIAYRMPSGIITIPCNQPAGCHRGECEDEVCTGSVDIDLDHADDGADPAAEHLLEQHGHHIEDDS